MNKELNQLKFKALLYSEMNMYDVTSINFDNDFLPDIITLLQDGNQQQYHTKEVYLSKYINTNFHEQDVYEFYTISSTKINPTLNDQWVVINWFNKVSLFNCGSKILYKTLDSASLIRTFYSLGFKEDNFIQMLNTLKTQKNI